MMRSKNALPLMAWSEGRSGNLDAQWRGCLGMVLLLIDEVV